MQNIGFPFDTENSYGYGKRLRFVRHAIEKYIKENHFNKRSVKILDIGCGTGFYLTFPLMSLGYNIIGVDPDLESIEYAKRINIYPNGSFIKSELKDLSSYNIFDIIICSEVLEHVEDPETFLYILKTKLKYNGIIILTIPNGFGAYEIDSFIYHKLRVKYCLIFLSRLKKFILYILGINTRHRNNETIIPVTYKNNDIHLQYFTYNKINALFKKTQLEIICKEDSNLWSGPFYSVTLGKFDYFNRLNTKLASHLPITLNSGWYFVLQTRSRS